MEKTVKFYDFQKALIEMQASNGFREAGIEFYQMEGFVGENPIEIGVNWGAIGTMTPEKTIEFAQKLVEAAEVAKSFIYNGYIIDYRG